MVNLHLHSEFSHDSTENMENYITAALANGDKILGFSEHYDYDSIIEGEDLTLPDLSKYSAAISDINARYGERVKTLKGIEFGYMHDALPRYRELIKTNDFDYIINSVHSLRGRGDCYYQKIFDGRSMKEAYLDYFNTVLESVTADFDFHIVGHIGYVSRYAPFTDNKIHYRDYAVIYDEILKAIIARDACLEINTSPGNAGSRFLPDTDILDRYLELGGKNFTFGSDAHVAANYKCGAECVKQYLLSRGIDKTCYFVKGQRFTEKI